jgi:drug/metabolite transporter (DMT)-like permease
MEKRRLQAYLLLLTTNVIWAVASPVIKYTLEFIPPFAFLFWRFLLTAVLFVPIIVVHHFKKPLNLKPKKVIQLGILGALGTTVSLGLFFLGMNYTTAIDAVLIDCIAPLLIVAGGAILLQEKVTKLEKIGSALAFVGSIVTIIQPMFEGKAFASQNILGNVFVMLSTISWAIYCLWLRKVEAKDKDKTDPLSLTAISFFAGLITIIPFFVWENFSLTSSYILLPTPLAIPGILFMAVFSSVIAYFTYNAGYALIEASEATIFDYLRPLLAAPIAVIWLKEQITIPFLLGAMIIFSGVFLAEYKPRK